MISLNTSLDSIIGPREVMLKGNFGKILLTNCDGQWARFTELNRILKGFRPNELTVLSGHTGVGKTTFLSEYSLDLAEQGVRTLVGSFEMPLRKICKMMLQQFSSEPLSSALPSRIVEWATMFRCNLPIYFINLHGSQNHDVVFKIMQDGVTQLGVEHVLIDNLQFLLGSGSTGHFDERFQAQDRFIQRLRSFANTYPVHVTVVAHPRKIIGGANFCNTPAHDNDDVGDEQEDSDRPLSTSSLYGGVKIAQESDNILFLQTELDSAYPRKYLQVVKNRYDGQLGRMDLTFHRDRLAFRPQARQLIVPSSDLPAETIKQQQDAM